MEHGINPTWKWEQQWKHLVNTLVILSNASFDGALLSPLWPNY